jgi:hypothetical protein
MSNRTSTTKKEFIPVPAGNYTVRVEKLDLAEGKTDKGEYTMAKVQLSIIGDNEYKGYRVMENYILNHTGSEKAVEIGRQKIESMLQNTGSPALGALNGEYGLLAGILRDKELAVEVYIKEQNNGYPPRNQVKKFARSF